MRLALLADLHANLEALTACLAHARSQGADAYAFLGDLVGYGADPVAVLQLVEEHVRAGAVAVRGNHDAAVLAASEAAGGAATMDRAAARAVAWTAARLGERERAFLAGLPLTARVEEALLVHASADRPEAWTYVDDALRAEECLAAAGAVHVFVGHVHVARLYHLAASGRAQAFTPVPGVPVPVPPRRRWLGVVGAVGQPRDGRTAAGYAMLDRGRGTLAFFRVPYDWRAAAAKVRAAGLPEALARRLEQGR